MWHSGSWTSGLASSLHLHRRRRSPRSPPSHEIPFALSLLLQSWFDFYPISDFEFRERGLRLITSFIGVFLGFETKQWLEEMPRPMVLVFLLVFFIVTSQLEWKQQLAKELEASSGIFQEQLHTADKEGFFKEKVSIILEKIGWKLKKKF